MLCASITATAYDFEVDGFYYDVNLEKMTATVVAGENKQAGDIIIPETVTYKGRVFDVIAIKGAFSGNKNLTGVSIPLSVTYLGDNTFDGCSSLISISGLDNVTTLGSSCFSGCAAITNIPLSPNLKEVGANAFNGCIGLVQISIPENVNVLGNGAFSDCKALSSIILPKDIITLSNDLFYNCESLKNLEIPSNVTTIGSGVFTGCKSLTTIEIPSHVISIGNNAFDGCSNLQNVIFADGTSTLHVGTKGSDSPLFADCRRLSDVYIGRNITYPWDSNGGGIPGYFSPFEGSSLQTIQFGPNVTTLYYWLFKNCNRLQSITLPPSIDTVKYGVFYGCTSISKLIIEDGTESLHFPDEGMRPYKIGVLFMNDCPLKDVYIGRNIAGRGEDSRVGYSLLYLQTQLKNISIGDYVTNITCLLYNADGEVTETLERYASLETLRVGQSLKFVPDLSNNNKLCSLSLTAITPQSATGFNNSQYMDLSPNIPIGSKNNYTKATIWKNFWEFNEQADLLTFFEVDGIRYHILTDNTVEVSSRNIPYAGDIIIPETVNYRNKQFKVVSVGDAFKGNTGITSIILPNSIETLTIGCFCNCTKLENIIFGNQVANIPANLLKGCIGLTSLTLPNHLKTIGSNAFEDCKMLNNIVLPEEVISIDNECFKNCSSLLSISLPSNVECLGSSVFSGCVQLKDVNWPSSLSSMPDYTFLDCKSLSEINGLGNLTQIGQGAFKNCLLLQSISLGEGLISIGNNAFAGSGLKALTIPGSVSSIGSDACAQCSSLSSLEFSASQNSISLGNKSYLNLSSSITPYPNATSVDEKRTGFRNGYYDGFFYGLPIEHLVINRNIELPKYYERTKGASTSKYSTVYNDIVYYPPFYGLTDLKSVEIGANVSSICKNQIEAVVNAVPTIMEYTNFGKCDNIEVVVSNNPTAPIGGGFTQAVYENAILFLPNGGNDSYMTDDYWKRFSLIKDFAFVAIESLSFEEDEIILDINENKTLVPIINPEDASIKKLKWSSSAPSIVNVTEDGSISSNTREGEVIITATTCDGTGMSASVKVVVQEGSGVSEVLADMPYKVSVVNKSIIVSGKSESDIVEVFNVQGQLVKSSTNNILRINAKGMYLVKIGSFIQKLIL